MKGSERITNQTMVTLFKELYVETDWKLLVYIASEGGKPTVKRKILIFPHSGIYAIRILKKPMKRNWPFHSLSTIWGGTSALRPFQTACMLSM